VLLELRDEGAGALAVRRVIEELALRLSQYPSAEVITKDEVQAVVGLEATKQMLGCTGGACAALQELVDGLDAKYLVTGAVSLQGGKVRTVASMLDLQTGSLVSRGEGESDRREDLWALADTLATPVPGAHPAPYVVGLSPLIPIGLVGAGAGVVVAGAAGVIAAVDYGTAANVDGTQEFREIDAATRRLPLEFLAVGAGALVAVIGGTVAGVGWLLTE
jgi:TolB-like protein